MTEEQAQTLAELFHGSAAHHSICLELDENSPHYKAAKKFFAARDAFGIRGWASEEEIKHLLLTRGTGK